MRDVQLYTRIHGLPSQRSFSRQVCQNSLAGWNFLFYWVIWWLDKPSSKLDKPPSKYFHQLVFQVALSSFLRHNWGHRHTRQQYNYTASLVYFSWPLPRDPLIVWRLTGFGLCMRRIAESIWFLLRFTVWIICSGGGNSLLCHTVFL